MFLLGHYAELDIERGDWMSSVTRGGEGAKFGPWPWFAEDELEAASGVIRSGKVNYWTGTECRDFEREYAHFLGVKHVIALTNGTVALELPLRMMGVGPGDEVVVTPRTFIASISCVVMQGATPVFADVDPESGNLTAESIEAVLSPRTKAAIPVHLAGWPCEMEAIMELASRRKFKVIEDCAQSHGASIRGKQVGSFGHAAAFSFCQDKIMTTLGEGGVLATDDEGLWDRAWSFKDHGKTWEAVYKREHPPGFRWVHDRFGTNWRMTEVQGAVGRRQLAKLPEWVEQRRRNGATLASRLDGLQGIRVPRVPDHLEHAFYKFYFYLLPGALRAGWTRDRVMATISDRGVPCFAGSCSEVYRERAFDNGSFRPDRRLPVARELGETSLMLLVHPTLGEAQMHHAADVVTEVLATAIR